MIGPGLARTIAPWRTMVASCEGFTRICLNNLKVSTEMVGRSEFKQKHGDLDDLIGLAGSK